MTTDFQKVIRGLFKEVSHEVIVVGPRDSPIPSEKDSVVFLINGRERGSVSFEKDQVKIMVRNLGGNLDWPHGRPKFL
jgi:hypothetical protein